VCKSRLNACNPLAPRIDKNLGNPVVKKVWGPYACGSLRDASFIRQQLVNGPGRPGVPFFSVIKSDLQSTHLLCLLQRIYCRVLLLAISLWMGTPHIQNSDTEYSLQTYILENFHSNLNKFFITSFMLHMLSKANPTG
jgi:hypothetical protein